ncbi:hypothetical protein GOBAR_AA16801 [Gossypium barbadense]|uniref:Uncharacterized protein n=1 Tax=Gossypium barbadense TaxID=3634 RepID=A0A2P5XKJ2_GOSBA|nr:hypothetical protein GOBAR_AA16801 [Gossypium barbadense]
MKGISPSPYSATEPPLAPPGSKTDDEEHRLFSPCFAAYPRVGFPTRGTIRPTLRPDSADGKGDLRRQSYAVVPGTPTISALTVVPRLEGRPEIAVLDSRERDERIDDASCCGSVGKEPGLETLADDVRFWASESLGQLGLV